MRHSKIAILLFSLLTMVALSFNPAKAQTNGNEGTVTYVAESGTTAQINAQDTAAAVVAPVFTGAEQNLADSVLAIGKALTDPELKVVVTDAYTVIKNGPEDNSFPAIYAWIIAGISALVAAITLIRQKFFSKPVSNTDRPETRRGY